jgi:type I restriction enzyme M protein
VKKGKPKNYIPEDAFRPLAAAFLRGELIDREVAVITRSQAEEADYNLSPSRWVGQSESVEVGSVSTLLSKLAELEREALAVSISLTHLLAGIGDEKPA